MNGPRKSTGEASRRALGARLETAIRGDVRFDDLTRTLYATDASIYEMIPAGVVLPRDVEFPRAWIDALLSEVPVFLEQTAEEALVRPLGDDLPAALISDTELDETTWARLVRLGDPEGIAFASREFERRWTVEELRYGERN